MEKKLIIYYSLHGNTRMLADKIKNVSGADVLEIESVISYPLDVWANEKYYDRITKNKEECELKTFDIKPEDYDVIILGTPNWAGSVSNPIITFLNKYDLSDKIIYPFTTHGGMGVQNVIKDLEKYCRAKKFNKALVLSSNELKSINNNEITNWLRCL